MDLRTHSCAARPFRLELVCLGNICRSPMADVVVRSRLEGVGLVEQVVVTSSGLGPWHVGEPMRPQARRALQARGYDGSAHRAQQLDLGEAAERDLVLVMDRDCERELRSHLGDSVDLRMFRSFDPNVWACGAGDPSEPGADLDVPDPYDGDAADFEYALDLVEAAAGGVVAELQTVLADSQQPRR